MSSARVPYRNFALFVSATINSQTYNGRLCPSAPAFRASIDRSIRTVRLLILSHQRDRDWDSILYLWAGVTSARCTAAAESGNISERSTSWPSSSSGRSASSVEILTVGKSSVKCCWPTSVASFLLSSEVRFFSISRDSCRVRRISFNHVTFNSERSDQGATLLLSVCHYQNGLSELASRIIPLVACLSCTVELERREQRR